MKSAMTLGIFLFVILCSYTLILLLLYLFQDKLVYFPDKTIQITPNDVGLPFTEYYFHTDDDRRLHGWYIPSENSRGTVLFFHGNAGNISHRLESIRIFHGLGLGVFIFDYRGYGLSDGKPNEQGTYRDADAAWKFITSDLYVEPQKVIIFGRSLGSAIAASLASRTQPGAVILESSFTSIPDLGAKLYPLFPVRLLARIKYPTNSFIQQIHVPLLFIHSKQDEIIPFEFGQKNFQIANEPKFFLELRGSHNDGFLISWEIYAQNIQQFLDKSGILTDNS